MNNSSVSYLRKPLALLCVGLSLFAANAAFAQTPPPSDTERKDETVKLEKFVVTGSFLPVSASVNASPVVTIENSSIGMSGATDALGLMKKLTPFFAGNGNVGTELNNGGGGESNVALRNLTTLVLLNGHRMVASPNSSGTSVDLNTIPVAMIDHIEIQKDGASTIYGSDAIGGVVNVILKKDYSGFTAGVKWGRTTKKNDYKTREAYIMGGVSTPGASITVAVSHYENNALLTTDRPLTILTPAQEAAMGFNVTSAVFSGSYPGRVGSSVLAGSTLIAIGAPGFNAAITSPGIKSSPSDTPKTLAQLQAAGVYLVVKTQTPAGIAVNGATALNTTLFGNPIILNTKRNEFVANGTKELFGKNLEVFGDFLYAQTTNGGSGLAPSPIAGVGAGGGNTLFIPANNPYNVFSVNFPGPLAARTRLIELGKRTSINETNTWHFVGGLKGEISDKYSWEASYNYSRATLTSQILGGANGANMNQAMIPLLDGSGNYVYNAAGRPLSTLTDASGNSLPVYNFFALPGFNDPATLNAIKTTLFQSAETTLRNISVVLKGKPFELPAGDVSFAAGIQTGKEEVASSVDALFANGLALGYNPAAAFSGGSRSTKGAFLEVGVPLVSAKQNIPGVHILALNLADRYEKIQPGGNANTPKFGVRWLPIDDSLVIRATYAKGFIAPSVFSLFGPAVGNSPTFIVLEGNGSPSAGGSLGRLTTIQGSSNQLSDPSLPASKSTSYSAGIVYSPKQVKGLTITVDYYKIKQDKVGGLDYTSIVADLNAKGSGSIYAQDIRHLGTGFVFADGTQLTSTAPNQVTSTNFGTITVANNPTGDQWTSGLDVAVDYRFSTAQYGQFAVGAYANILFNYMFRANASAPYFQYARNFTDGANGLGGQNGLLPSYIIKPYISHTYGGLATSLFLNYVPTVTAPGSLFGGANTVNTDTINGLAYKIPSYFTADLAFSYSLPSYGKDWARNLTLTVGANNILNKQPPYVPASGNGEGENNTVKNTYDIIGRFVFVELKKAF
jgi:iron complex outermembrane receptor protein